MGAPGPRMQSLNILRYYANRSLDSIIQANQEPGHGQVAMFKMAAHNRTGSTTDIGLGHTLSTNLCKIYKIVDASSPKTTDITSNTLSNFTTQIFEANNDGLMIQGKKPFSVFDITAVLSDSGSPVYSISYFNGVSFATLPTESIFTAANTGKNLVCFVPPVDWAPGFTAAYSPASGGDQSLYTILLKSSTAPSQSPRINTFRYGVLLSFREGVADNSSLELEFFESRPHSLEFGEYPMAYFKDAAANNMTELSYTVS